MHRTDQAKSKTNANATTGTNGAGEPRAVRILSLAVCAAALAAAAAFLATGAEAPAPGPVLLLSLAAALCVNRFALFPSEHAVTAEAAVLLAAIVGFRADAVVLGPLVVALLVGPLDALHWEQRSFVRMAYNAGNRGLATLAAAGAFVVARDLLDADPSPAAWCVVVLVAASTFVLVDGLISATLLRLTGEPFVPAVRFVFDADVFALPVACLGACTGLLAGWIGWWATALALVPVAFLPELVIARAHQHARAVVVREIALLLATVALLAVFALMTPVPGTAMLAMLMAIALLGGVEFAVDRSMLLPPMLAVVVVAAVVTVDAPGARFAAALLATVATATSWWATAGASRTRCLAAVATAFGSAVLAAELAVQLPRTMLGVALGALGAGLVFEAVAVSTGESGRRRVRSLAVMWSVPLLAAAVAWAMVWRSLGAPVGGGVVFAVALAGTCAGAAWWGAPTWRSRVVQLVATLAPARRLFPVLGAIGAAAVVSTVVGVLAHANAHEHALAVGAAWTAAGLGETVVAMAAFGVRQWRFAPRPRARGLVVVLLAAGAFVSAVPTLVVAGSWWGPVLAATVTAAVAAIARHPAQRARAASTAANQVPVP